jgi:hypothetical protein
LIEELLDVKEKLSEWLLGKDLENRKALKQSDGKEKRKRK